MISAILPFIVILVLAAGLSVCWYYIGRHYGYDLAMAQRLAIQEKARDEDLSKIDTDRINAISEYLKNRPPTV